MSEKRKVAMEDALAAGDGVIMTARRLRIEELEAENERLRADRLAKLFFGLLLTIALFFLCAGSLDSRGDFKDLKHQAIDRGYALHCPHDGEFAWVGECEEGE